MTFAGLTLSFAAACNHPAPAPSVPPNPRQAQLDALIPRILQTAAPRLARAAQLDMSKGYPRSTLPNGTWEQVSATSWTSGFFPGALWQMYELTGHDSWKREAARWTAGLESNKTRTNTHDLGFLIFDSYGHGFRLTGDARYRDVILAASRSLATRFNPAVGAIKSWDIDRVTDGREKWGAAFPVIIDNMMNLEMLFWASAHGGGPAWKDMAERHALTSSRAHVREDGSTAHVALFDATTGAFLRRVTWQGHSDTSVWARGQAWAIHGFTRAYEETKNAELLVTARRVADWYLAHLPADAVPYWDFRDPAIPNAPRDASAAAIAASGLLQLARHADSASTARYRDAAERTLLSLATTYQDGGTSGMALLKHSVGGKPQNSEVDVGIVYADYYFLEALRNYRVSRTGSVR